MGFMQMQMPVTCPKCKGKGKTMKKTCKKCRAKGVVPDKKQIEVVVEPGMDDGSKIVFEGEAEQ